MTLEHIITNLHSLFSSRSDILFIVVFGSRARKEEHINSDLDVGIFYTRSPDLLTLGGDIADIEEELGIKTDVLVLNGIASSNPELAYNIASDAVSVFEKEKNMITEFKTRAYTAYFDFLPVIEKSKQDLTQRVQYNMVAEALYAEENPKT